MTEPLKVLSDYFDWLDAVKDTDGDKPATTPYGELTRRQEASRAVQELVRQLGPRSDRTGGSGPMIALADALEKCDWSNTSIGNKALLKNAIETLRAAPPKPAPDALDPDGADPENTIAAYRAAFFDMTRQIKELRRKLAAAQSGKESEVLP